MSILSDHSIKKLCLPSTDKVDFQPMITPFLPEQCRVVDNQKIVSYGLSSFGYDVRLGRKFKIFTNVRNAVIDPLNPDPDCFVDHEGDYCIIPPNSYILSHTMETFNIPRDVMVVCVGKSTYARLAAIVNVTPIEPGFKGDVVIEIANCSTLPLKVYAGQGIAQFMFFRGDRPCDVSYADKGGKYQNQSGLTTARL
jgi:dCTP deaminase